MIILILLGYFVGISGIWLSPNQNQAVPLDDLNLIVHENGPDFPKSFSVNVDKLDHKLDGHFEILNDFKIPPVSILDNGKAKLVNFTENEKHQIYREKNGRGFATLVKNNYDGSHRILARVFQDANRNEHYDIGHRLKANGRFGSKVYEHFMHKRSVPLEFGSDYKTPPKGKFFFYIFKF